MLSPKLRNRIDRLASCRGHWLLIRDGSPDGDCSYAWHDSPDGHLTACLADRWRSLSLGFVPSYCGYSDYSDTGLVGLANYRSLTESPDWKDAVLTVGYGWNGMGCVINVRFADDSLIDAIQELESYPLIDEELHGQIEFDAINQSWQDDSLGSRIQDCVRCGLSMFAARRDSAPWESDRLRDFIVETLNEYPTCAA